MNYSIESKLQNIFQNYRTSKLTKGTDLLNPDEEPAYIFYLSSGYVRSYSITEDGNELTINIFKPQTFFPMVTVLAKQKNMYFYETFTDVLIQKAPKKEVLDQLMEDKEILRDLLERLSIGMEGFLLRMQILSRAEAKQKIAATLVMLSRRFGINHQGKTTKITLPLTHQDIANLAGTSRETTSIEIKKLENQGILKRKSKITYIENFLALKKASLIYEDNQPLPYTF